jgi:VWFA-related protein
MRVTSFHATAVRWACVMQAPTRKRLTSAFGVLMLGAATLCGAGQQPDATQKPTTTFRSRLDVIAVDVQVSDRNGVPVSGLGPDKFTVTINGRRRRVLSAELVESRSATSLTPVERAAAIAGPPVRPTLARVVYIAIDCLSFDVSASRHVIDTARAFIDRLPPTDEVGLFAYPYGPKISPTTDHAAVGRSLATVLGQRHLPFTQFHLRPAEIVDLSGPASSSQARESSLLESVVVRECGDTPDDACRRGLMLEIAEAALYYEGQGNAGLGMLRSLLQQLSVVNARKTLVLISAGMMASDAPGGRPDISELGMQVGREAARSNTSVYTLFLDTSTTDRFQAQVRGADKDLQNVARDGEILGRWLEQFSGEAGGALFRVQVGSGEYAFDRVLNEISAYYLLGVEPGDEDRDGRTHEIKVRTSQKDVVIRGRRWVMVPRRDAAASGNPSARTSEPAASKEKAPPPPGRAVPADIQAMADAFNRGEPDFQRALADIHDLATLLRSFRGSDAPWPDAPGRTAVFALELAVAALRSDNPYARDEGGRLLAEYNVRLRRPEGADDFECSWLWTEVAALEGLFVPDSAIVLLPGAVERCPREGRLHLAHAIISEQRWLRGTASANDETSILDRYQAAIRFPDTAAEARMRAAWFLCRVGKLDEALALVDVRPPGGTDPYVLYLTDLVRGQVLRARGRLDEAEKAYRDALATWPGAQSARVALMTLRLSRGDRQEAAKLAEAVETPSGKQFDPWWTFWLGDYRVYPTIVARLREIAR